MEVLLATLSKVLVIFLLVVVGYFFTKKGMISERGAGDITNILTKACTPCVIINAFIASKGNVELSEMGYALCIAVISLLVSVAIGRLGLRDEGPMRLPVLRFAVTFSNMGFMGVPLVQGIVGPKGVVYASFGIVTFNLLSWTYGYRMMNSSAKMTLRTILL